MRMKQSASLAAMVMCAQIPAHANHIQSFGQSEACISQAGACVALEGDFGAFYHNPAAATDFDSLVIGGNFRFLDTREVDLIDSGGAQDIVRSNKDGDYILAPSLGAYKPINDRVTLGIGLGAPFAITADWGNDEGIHRYNMSDQSLYVLDLSPNVAFKVNDKLSVGAAANIVIGKQLRTESLIPQSFGAALPPSLGGAGAIIPTTPDSPVIGSITLETDGDYGLGIPPDQFESAFDSVSFTLGAQYNVSDRLRLGGVYRSKTNLDWEGQLRLDLSPAGLGVQETEFSTKLDGPAHLQLGASWKAIPEKLNLSLDIQRTFWSDTDGFGKPLVIETAQPLLGFVNDIVIDYRARDTNTYRLGGKYNINDKWSVLAGYAYDESFIPDSQVDILVYDSNRHIWSAGFEYNKSNPETGSGFRFNAGLQYTYYEERTIAAGESANLGGFSLPNLTDADTLSFSPNREEFAYGGPIPALGFSLQYTFGKK